MKGNEMTNVKTIDAIRFKLEFMVLMMNTGRTEEAQTCLDKAFEMLAELKSSAECSAVKPPLVAKPLTVKVEV
jgi:hypothetical protein